MTILIVEDEDLAVKKLKATVLAVEKEAVVAGVTHSVESTVQWLQQNPAPDLILMDIELTDGLSFEIFNQVEVNSPVIFVTSYDAYAIRAFKVNSVDYLLKPVEEEDLRPALKKYHHWTARYGKQQLPLQNLVKELQQLVRPPDYRNRFLVKQGQRLVAVEVKDIAYIVAIGRLSYLFTWDKHKYVVDYTLEELEQELDPLSFFRANRSCIMHVKSVKDIHNYFNGKLKLELVPETEHSSIIISREKAGSFKDWMGK
jgi:DNA-binding LytR/AlgR family response regulator